MPVTGTFQEVLSEAIDDLLAHGFDSIERVAKWTRELRMAAERSTVGAAALDQQLRDGLVAIYRKMVERGEIARYHPGVPRFTIDRVRPALRSELDRRIAASIDLIKLNKSRATEEMIQRFSGWSTSIPKGGTSAETKRETKDRVKKSLQQLPFQERRLFTDQGHKLIGALNEIIAADGGAIAGEWRSHWRQANYDYREDHKERDGKIYLMRNSWAHTAGLVKKGPAGYYDEVTAVGQEVSCRCFMVWLYSVSALPADMITAKGRDALAAIRGRDDSQRRTARADSDEPKLSKSDAAYVGPMASRPTGMRCDECTMFVRPGSCTKVAGLIDPGGYCRYFERSRGVDRADTWRAA